VTVTDPRMTRFFMSIEEAVQLVLQASALADPTHGEVFMLDMGEPVRILDLAERMISLAGLSETPEGVTASRGGEV
jgi:FlaA1/EpsC-like NDP-sugar epimerase